MLTGWNFRRRRHYEMNRRSTILLVHLPKKLGVMPRNPESFPLFHEKKKKRTYWRRLYIYIYNYKTYLGILLIFQLSWDEMRKEKKNIRNYLPKEVSVLWDPYKNKTISDYNVLKKYLFSIVLNCRNCFWMT